MLYAVKRLYDGRRHIAFGFIRDLKERSDSGDTSWGGTMCLPREVYADGQGQLRTRPVHEIVRAFNHKIWDLGNAPEGQVRAGKWNRSSSQISGKGDHCAISFPVPNDYMLVLEAKPSPIGKMVVRFRDQGPHGGGYSLAIDMLHQTTELRGPLYVYERSTVLPNDKPVQIRAFVCGDILECFVDDAHAFACRCYDFRQGRLLSQSNDGRLDVTRMEIWQAQAVAD
jgi:hypothetical protein